MTLQRTTIREAAVAALRGRTAAGDRVWSARVLPVVAMPAILVATPRERAELVKTGAGWSLGALDLAVTLTLEIHCQPDTGSPSADVDGALDALCAAVLAVLSADAPFRAAIAGVAGLETELGFARGERPQGVAVLTMQVLASQA